MALENRYKSLIAVGASIAANCQSCLKYHSEKAVEAGANDQENSDAIKIGRAVREAASSRMDKFASARLQSESTTGSSPFTGCGCGS